MKFSLSSAILFILAVPWASARPATPTTAISAVTSVAAPTSTDVVDTSFAVRVPILKYSLALL